MMNLFINASRHKDSHSYPQATKDTVQPSYRLYLVVNYIAVYKSQSKVGRSKFNLSLRIRKKQCSLLN